MEGYRKAKAFADEVIALLGLPARELSEEEEKRDEILHTLVMNLLKKEGLRPRDLPRDFYLKMDAVVKRGSLGDVIDLVREIESWIALTKM